MRAHLTCTPLDDRITPAVNVSLLGGGLLVTGTPDLDTPFGTPSPVLAVSRTTGDFYQVTEGVRDLGTFRVTRGITLSLDSFDSDIQVDLNGGTLRGDLTIDLGTGDRNPNSFNLVALAGGGGTVTGSVSIRGTSSSETLAVGYANTFAESPVTVRGDVTAVSRADAAIDFDYLAVGPGTTVRGSVLTRNIPILDMLGTVGRDVTHLANGGGGMFLFVFGGTVGGNLYAEGAATVPRGFLSFNILEDATIRGDATIRVAGEGWAVTFVDIETTIGKNFTYAASGSVDTTLITGGTVRVGRSVVLDLNTTAGTFSDILLAGSVGGSVAVNDRAGDLTLQLGRDGFDSLAVRGGIAVNAGSGTNDLTFDGAGGSTAGGPVVYSGGAGSDTVTITGSENRFDLFVFVGGGDDTVAFAPDAKVKSALIVFGTGGTNTWVPPDAIDFPLTLIGF